MRTPAVSSGVVLYTGEKSLTKSNEKPEWLRLAEEWDIYGQCPYDKCKRRFHLSETTEKKGKVKCPNCDRTIRLHNHDLGKEDELHGRWEWVKSR